MRFKWLLLNNAVGLSEFPHCRKHTLTQRGRADGANEKRSTQIRIMYLLGHTHFAGEVLTEALAHTHTPTHTYIYKNAVAVYAYNRVKCFVPLLTLYGSSPP